MGAMNEFKVLDPTGHTSTRWDADSPQQVETARRVFEDFMKRGYRAFKMDTGAGEGVAKSAFDPQDKETLLVPPIRAG